MEESEFQVDPGLGKLQGHGIVEWLLGNTSFITALFSRRSVQIQVEAVEPDLSLGKSWTTGQSLWSVGLRFEFPRGVGNGVKSQVPDRRELSGSRKKATFQCPGAS